MAYSFYSIRACIRCSIWVILLHFNMEVSAQDAHNVKGYISDYTNGEILIGANVFDTLSNEGVVSNEYGYYSIRLPEGITILKASFVGYTPLVKSFDLNKDTSIHFQLKPGLEMEEVIISGADNDRFLSNMQPGMVSLNARIIEQTPVILGESDLIKTMQLLPGVQGGHEGFSGMHVRGGSNDQNLILLDGVPIYNLNHFFGMFSVFDPSVIKNVKLFKGAFPARYQGRASSVLDIRTKDGNMNEIKGQGSVGLLSSKFYLEGPLKKDTSSFIFSARRTYIDLLLTPFLKSNTDGGLLGYYFYDLNGKINYRFSDKSRLFISGYIGKDNFYEKNEGHNAYRYTSEESLYWGNSVGSLRWNYVFAENLFLNTTFYYSRFRFSTGVDADEVTGDSTRHISYEYFSGVNDLALKADISYNPSNLHSIRTGVKGIRHSYYPGVEVGMNSNYIQTEVDTVFGAEEITGHELVFYVEDKWTMTPAFSVNMGVNFNGYLVESKQYWNFEPRLSINYEFNQKTTVKASYNISHQYIHLLTNNSIGLPTDLWVPVTASVPPLRATQYALSGNHYQEGYSIMMDFYYKTLDGLVAYKNGATFFSGSEGWEENVSQGSGTSYGMEVMVQKNTGKVTGWLSYALSKHNRQFDELNNGKPFAYKYDRRHAISLSAGYSFNKKTKIQGTWVYNSGRMATLPSQRYFARVMGRGARVYDYQEINNIRFPDYHRLDIGLVLTKRKQWGERIWKLGMYNAYSRINPFYLQISSAGRFEKVGIFPAFPYINYVFKF